MSRCAFYECFITRIRQHNHISARSTKYSALWSRVALVIVRSIKLDNARAYFSNNQDDPHEYMNGETNFTALSALCCSQSCRHFVG
ncbi:hypothetical protein Plhal304r1_c086g0169561 [Plasmopara halstedii]